MMVLTATNAAKKSAARAQTPYKWVCELISASLSKLSLLLNHSLHSSLI